MSALPLTEVADADVRRQLSYAMDLRIRAKAHEAQAKTLKDEAVLIDKALMEKSGLSSVQREDGYTLNYVTKMLPRLDQKKLTEELANAGVDAQIIADAMVAATNYTPSQYVELRAPKE